MLEFASQANEAVDAARPRVAKNKKEFERIANDVQCIEILSKCYAEKARAAMHVLRYRYSHDAKDLHKALPHLEKSLVHYRQLVSLTEKTYRDAGSLHTHSRRIPFVAGPDQYIHWRQCLPKFEQELANFRRHLAEMDNAKTGKADEQAVAALPVVVPKVIGENSERFEVKTKARLFTDRDYVIDEVAGELRGMHGIRIAHSEAKRSSVAVEFELPEPSQILVGFFEGEGSFAKPPKDEWEPVIQNAVASTPPVRMTVYAHLLPGGRHRIDFGKGSYVVLGFTKANTRIEPRVVTGGSRSLDWLFE